MAILKNKIKDNYTIIPNAIIYDSKISNNGFRLLVYLWSKPSNWIVNQKNIAKDFEVQYSTVKNWIKELKELNYLTINKINKGQRFDYEYNLHDKQFTMASFTKANLTMASFTTAREIGRHNKTNNNKIEYNNKDNNSVYFDNDSINDLFNEFLENRKDIFGRKINTKRSIQLLVNKLNKVKDEEKVRMLNNSIENGWKGLFESQNKNTKKEIGNTKGWYQEEKDGELSKEEIDEMNEIIKMM